jgi:hypothetical protein
MKLVPFALLLVVAGCASSAPHTSAPAADLAASSAAAAQRAWLQQLVGEWTVVCEADMGPDGTMKMEGKESVRSIGGMWVVGEGSGTMMGQPMSSVMTLGYDDGKGGIVGTWVDSMQSHLWTYKGTLDAAGKTLTLDTEGPSFDGSGKLSRYRDAITIKDKNHKTLTSSMQNADGSWTTFMTAEYTRKS